MRTRISALTLGIAAIFALAIWAVVAPGAEREVSRYASGLNGRTKSQVHNLVLATRRINGTVIQPGQTFSFIKTVGPWTADMGYEKAPVSYDGELVRSWGGGVCQASTALYNTALLAGLEIVERHRHHWPARYAPPGRDAAVAYSDIDLKIRNNFPAPVRLTGEVRGDSLIFRVMSTHQPDYSVRVETEIREVLRPNEVLQNRSISGEGRWKLINRGRPGFSVVTYRRFISSHGSRRQLLSEDVYPACNRIIRIAQR